MPPKLFKIMDPPPGCPRHLPWELVAPHEGQALDNHDQSLETLHSRGGLDPVELYLVMTGQKLFPAVETMDRQVAVDFITALSRGAQC